MATNSIPQSGRAGTLRRALQPHFLLTLLSFSCVAVLGCGGDELTFGSGGAGGSGGAQASSSSTGSTSTGGTSTGGTSTGSTSTGSSSSGTAGSGGAPGCEGDLGVDNDGDGATEVQGDCNDCDKLIGPGAIEIITAPMGQPQDEDCDGIIDNVLPTCDDMLALDDVNAQNGARAVDLCQFVAPEALTWGVLDAKYVRANGDPATPAQQVGLQSNFGPNVNVQNGARLLALSSGRARLPTQMGSCGMHNCADVGPGVAPPGFPQSVPNCPASTKIFDDVGLEVKLRAPTNASGYQFSFRFYTFEYPEWKCNAYNDQFVTLINPSPVGSINGNITFDEQANPIGVNTVLLDVCMNCMAGTDGLLETGFDIWNDAGGTSWLTSQAPVQGGTEVVLRWAIWDAEDTSFDSTTLVDNFRWITNGSAVMVGTTKTPNPK